MVPPLELFRLPLSTDLPYLNIPLFCFDSEFVPFVCLFFPTMLNTASLILPKKFKFTYILSKNSKLLIYALKGAVFVENLDGGQFILFYDRGSSIARVYNCII